MVAPPSGGGAGGALERMLTDGADDSVEIIIFSQNIQPAAGRVLTDERPMYRYLDMQK